MRRFLIILALLAVGISPAFSQAFKGPDQRAVIGGLANTNRTNTFQKNQAFVGNITVSGQINANGTGTPVNAAGNITIIGNTGLSTTLSASPAGLFYLSSASGLVIRGQGSTNDVTFTNHGNTGGILLPDASSTVQIFSPLSLDSGGTARISESTTVPTIASGFCGSPTIPNGNNTWAFTINVGTSCAASSGVLTFPAAPHAWTCQANDITTPGSNFVEQSAASSATSVTLTNYVRTTGIAGNFTSSDIIQVMCAAY
jgi:hypothetical protein